MFNVELKVELCGEVVVVRGEVAFFRGEMDIIFARISCLKRSLVSPVMRPLGCFGVERASSLGQPDRMRP